MCGWRIRICHIEIYKLELNKRIHSVKSSLSSGIYGEGEQTAWDNVLFAFVQFSKCQGELVVTTIIWQVFLVTTTSTGVKVRSLSIAALLDLEVWFLCSMQRRNQTRRNDEDNGNPLTRRFAFLGKSLSPLLGFNRKRIAGTVFSSPSVWRKFT